MARKSTHNPGAELALYIATSVVMLLALLLGGASHANLLQVSVVEAAALALLGYCIWGVVKEGRGPSLVVPAAIMTALAAVCLLQLAPLPPGLWAAVPGHATPASALALADIPERWRPYSLTPDETLKSLLALLPPFAVFLATTLLRERFRRWLAATIVAAALASILVGLLQTGHPRLDFYGTAQGFSPGFFSNRNHQASLLVCAIPLIAYIAGAEQVSTASSRAFRIIVACAAMLVLVAGLVIVKSRAGVLLLGPCLLLSLALLWRSRQFAVKPQVILALLVFGVLAGAGALVVAAPFLDRFSHGGLADVSRSRISMVVAGLGVRYLPFGSGLGSFVSVYGGAESVQDMARIFWNHAHNDYVELWLEAGLAFVAIAIGFLAWAGRRGVAAWTASPSHSSLAGGAGSIVVLLLLLHSGVDYPLRTLALACVFAFSCGLMNDPRLIASSASRGRRSAPVAQRPASKPATRSNTAA